MRTFEVVLTKSYIVRIKAENKEKAKEYSELFTGDIQDISSVEERKNLRIIYEEFRREYASDI